jgi:hypothetical protein
MVMSSRFYWLSAIVLVSVFGASFAFAQSTQSGAPKSALESSRDRRKALEDETAKKQKRLDEFNKRTLEAVLVRNQKRADCRSRAKQQNLRFMKRTHFIQKCIAAK